MQKNKLWVLMTLVCFLFGALQEAQAQSRNSKNKEKKEDASFASKLWYGGGVSLGDGVIGNGQFGFGISPMVGYKIIPMLSVGPRATGSFISIKQAGTKAVTLFNLEMGAFVRAKVFRGLFIQGEVANEWRQYILNGEKTNSSRFNQYLGAGWNFGNGSWGQEIGIFYNFAIANDTYSSEQPFSYRFGFTYRF